LDLNLVATNNKIWNNLINLSKTNEEKKIRPIPASNTMELRACKYLSQLLLELV